MVSGATRTLEVLRNPLDEQQADILNQERALLGNLRVTLARLDAAPDDQRRLAEALTQQFVHELSQSLQRIREAILPYTLFVQAERDKLGEIEGQLITAAATIQTLRAWIKDL